MNKKLYKLMDWPAIEGIIYADDSRADALLGVHEQKGNDKLIQCYYPGASMVEVVYSFTKNVTQTETIAMEMADDAGFFAVLIKGEISTNYKYRVHYNKGKKEEVITVYDPYSFVIPKEEKLYRQIMEGTSLEAQKYFGANVTMINGIEGVLYRVYAPEAAYVGLLLEDETDASFRPMLKENDVFSLFIPEGEEGADYRFYIKSKHGGSFAKKDPFEHALIRRAAKPVKTDTKAAFLLYQLNAADLDDLSEKDLTLKVQSISEQGFTALMISSVLDGEDRFGVRVPSELYKKTISGKLSHFIKEARKKGLKIYSDISLGLFDAATGLLTYDGSAIFEHLDERQGRNYRLSAGIFNYNRGFVKSYLFSAVKAYIDMLSLDGLMIRDTSLLLYLDYCKDEGEYIPNMYGGKEKLDAISFLKDLNKTLKKTYPNLLLLTDEFSGWQNMTTPLSEDGFGFDVKYNHAYLSELMKYMALDPIMRPLRHNDLTMSYLYSGMEDFVLAVTPAPLSKCEKGLSDVFVNELSDEKKLLYAYTMVHPGKKAFGEELVSALPSSFVEATNKFYLSQNALSMNDRDENNLEWINAISANESVLVFLRKGQKAEDMLLICVNMSGASWKNHKIGVPLDGKYKEIYNSESNRMGGSYSLKTSPFKAKEEECDMRPYSIKVTLPALSVAVYSYVPYTEKELMQIKAKLEEKQRREEEAKALKEKLKKEKEKIRKNMKEELQKQIQKAEEAIAKGSERIKRK